MKDQLPRFLDRGFEKPLTVDELLWKEGERPLVAHVLQGRLQYSLDGELEGKLKMTCAKGDILGLVDTHVEREKFYFKAWALEESLVYCWTREQFSLAIGLYQELAKQTIRVLSSRLRLLNDLHRGRGR